MFVCECCGSYDEETEICERTGKKVSKTNSCSKFN